MNPEPSPAIVLCFGEVLWDCLPQGLFAGGAPINVAYHLRRLGLEPVPVTAVGRDFLGRELKRRFKTWSLPLTGVHETPDKETGAVLVELDDQGSASYEIRQDAAWDWIELPDALEESASQAQAIVYGSLAQRNEHNRRQWRRLKQWAPKAHRVFDVNLRPPFDSADLVLSLCRDAHLIKLNNQELGRLLQQDTPAGSKNIAAAARAFSSRLDCPRVCVTAGSEGAGLLWDGDWLWEPARPVEVKDTIGAGDSFLAGLLHGWLGAQEPPDAFLADACRLSEFVAGSRGAMPSYSLRKDGTIQREH